MSLISRSCELTAALERRRIDFCAVQETRWSSSKSKELGHGFKIVHNGSPKTRNGVGIIFSQRFRDSIAEVLRFDDRLIKVVIITADQRLHFFSAYAPQMGCYDQVKDDFWMLLDEKAAEVPPEGTVVVAGDLNGHVGVAKDGYRCHGGFRCGIWNEDGERILEYADSHNLAIMSTNFQKRPSHLVSYYSGNMKTQIDFVLVKHRDQKLATDAKVVPYETVATQHRPLICSMKITLPRRMHDERCGPVQIKCWWVKEKEATITSTIKLPPVTTVDETWKNATRAIAEWHVQSLVRLNQVAGELTDRRSWTDEVKVKVHEKKRLYHVFLGDKTDDNWLKYLEAKKAAKKAVAATKAEHCDNVRKKLDEKDGGESLIYRLARSRQRQAEDVEKFYGVTTNKIIS